MRNPKLRWNGAWGPLRTRVLLQGRTDPRIGRYGCPRTRCLGIRFSAAGDRDLCTVGDDVELLRSGTHETSARRRRLNWVLTPPETYRCTRLMYFWNAPRNANVWPSSLATVGARPLGCEWRRDGIGGERGRERLGGGARGQRNKSTPKSIRLRQCRCCCKERARQSRGRACPEAPFGLDRYVLKSNIIATSHADDRCEQCDGFPFASGFEIPRCVAPYQ